MILLIDDEPRYMDSYHAELKEAGYDVVLQSDIDEALAFFARRQDEIALVILDIMMPPRNAFRDADTRKGRRTGVHLYGALRERAPELKILILTNVSDPDVETLVVGDSHCRFLRKFEYYPHEVREVAQTMLADKKE